MNYAQPESAAESITRIGGAIAAAIGALTLWGLYASQNPSNWLSNIGLSIGNNDFRTLSIFGAASLIIGIALFAREGLYLIVVGMVVSLAIAGNGKWYSIGNNTSPNVKIAAMSDSYSKSNSYIQTGIRLTPQQLASCNQDDDNDGILNRNESTGWQLNCTTGIIHKVQRQ